MPKSFLGRRENYRIIWLETTLVILIFQIPGAIGIRKQIKNENWCDVPPCQADSEKNNVSEIPPCCAAGWNFSRGGMIKFHRRHAFESLPVTQVVVKTEITMDCRDRIVTRSKPSFVFNFRHSFFYGVFLGCVYVLYGFAVILLPYSAERVPPLNFLGF